MMSDKFLSNASSGSNGVDCGDFDLMLSTVMYLMTQYASDPDPRLAHAICAHISGLLDNYPELSDAFRKNLKSLRAKWRQEVMDDAPQFFQPARAHLH